MYRGAVHLCSQAMMRHAGMVDLIQNTLKSPEARDTSHAPLDIDNLGLIYIHKSRTSATERDDVKNLQGSKYSQPNNVNERRKTKGKIRKNSSNPKTHTTSS